MRTYAETMSELAVESAPDVAAAAHDAARGQVVYITECGNRVAGIVPVELAAILDRLTTDELDQLSAAAELAGLANAAGLIEDLADRAAVLESRAAPGVGVPSEQLGVSYQVTWSERASKHLRQLDKPVRQRVVDTVNDLASTPRPPGVKPVIGLPGVLRVREGHWRVLYAVDDDRRAIWIEDVRRRSRVHGGH
jgi:mRNA-degrading endonuclease RelE of RelBE toxin-antitoxin system